MGLKSMATAGFLAFLFGPLGMFYTSFAAVLVFTVVDIMLIVNQNSFVFLMYLIGIGCNVWMAKEHNDKVEALFARGRQ